MRYAPMFSLLRYIVLVFLPMNRVSAYTTFTPNCSSLDDEVNFVHSSNSRSTLEIFWTCLFTLIACTWTILHLNIPEQRAGRDPGWKGDMKWTLKRTWTKTKWMITAMLAPEVLVGFAMGNLAHAKQAKHRLKQFLQQDDVPWSLMHSMFIDMGGFVIQAAVYKSAPSSNEAKVLPVEAIHPADKVRTTRYYHLTSFQLHMLRKNGILARLPNISKDELNARSKSDAFSKTIAVAQIIWLMFQVILRAARGLAISQLELAVAAFSICGILIYALSWNKPKDCQVPIAVMQYNNDIPADLLQKLNEFHDLENDSVSMMSGIPLSFGLKIRSRSGSNIRNDISWISSSPGTRPYFSTAHIANAAGVVLGTFIFGAVHTLAWNFHFPTEIERTIWRTSSVVCTILPVAISCLKGPALNWHLLKRFFKWFKLFFRLKFDVDYQFVIDFFIVSSLPVANILYVAARLYMMVEIFRTLCYLPVDAYTSTWISNIPHVT